MVVMRCPAARETGSTQERCARPSRWTVQAPHSAMPQPYLVPVRPSTSRSTQSSGMSAGTATSCSLPLTWSFIAAPPASNRLARQDHHSRRRMQWKAARHLQRTPASARVDGGRAPPQGRPCKLFWHGLWTRLPGGFKPMRKRLTIVLLCGAMMVAPGLVTPARASHDWLAIGTAFRVGAAYISFVFGPAGYGYSPSYYYRYDRPIRYGGVGCSRYCFRDAGYYYHHESCPL